MGVGAGSTIEVEDEEGVEEEDEEGADTADRKEEGADREEEEEDEEGVDNAGREEAEEMANPEAGAKAVGAYVALRFGVGCGRRGCAESARGVGATGGGTETEGAREGAVEERGKAGADEEAEDDGGMEVEGMLAEPEDDDRS